MHVEGSVSGREGSVEAILRKKRGGDGRNDSREGEYSTSDGLKERWNASAIIVLEGSIRFFPSHVWTGA